MDAHTMLPTPIVLAASIQLFGTNLRCRTLFGKVSGPGLITWAMFEHQSGNVSNYAVNIYASPVPLSELTNNSGTTDLEGTPILPIVSVQRGVKGISISSSNTPAFLPLYLPLPAGSNYLYMCHAATANVNVSLHGILGYQAHP